MNLYYFIVYCNNCFTQEEVVGYFRPHLCNKCESDNIVILDKGKMYD